MSKNTRLLRKDELQAVRNGAMPRLPDCFQTKPKKVVTTEPASVLALTVDGQGVHCVVRYCWSLSSLMPFVGLEYPLTGKTIHYCRI